MSEVRARYRTARQTLDGMMTEKDFQQQVTDLARLCRYVVYHTRDSRGSAAGYPDLVLAKAGRKLILAELKRERGRLTPAQTMWIEVLSQVPGIAVRVWRPSDWPEIERELRA